MIKKIGYFFGMAVLIAIASLASPALKHQHPVASIVPPGGDINYKVASIVPPGGDAPSPSGTTA